MRINKSKDIELSIKEQNDLRLKKHKGNKTKSPKKSVRQVKSKDPVGNIYFVHPSHVVDKKDFTSYKNQKGNSNYRPVAIVKKKKDNEVEIAKLYSKPNKKHRDKITDTKSLKNSYIDKTNQSTSRSTGKVFKEDRSPLKKRTGKIAKSDIKRREKKKGHH